MDLRLFLALVVICTAWKVGESRDNSEHPEPPHSTGATSQGPVVCVGTKSGMTIHGSPRDRYETLRDMYTNCTSINGNLEINFLDDDESPQWDLSFLETIQEVTGYVLIVSVYTDYIPLTNLRIIRGMDLHHRNDKYYALYIVNNGKPETDIGLKELRFRSLYEISNGDVMLYNNNLLCYTNTIMWADILSGENAGWSIHERQTINEPQCGECDPSCNVEYEESGGIMTKTSVCWGSGPDMCQTLTRKVCAKQCDGRCFGTGSRECCHAECAGGCTGPTKTECWSCQHFKNNDSCVPFCPPPFIYDTATYSYVENPHAKYSYGTICQDECPSHLLIKAGACVARCGDGQEAIAGKCEPCDGPCPKTCKGVEVTDSSPFLHTGNLADFNQCTIVEGNIVILPSTFSGDPMINHVGLNVSDLAILETVVEVGGHVKIQGAVEGLTNLSFLRNLETIHGRVLDSIGASVHVMNTNLESLDLVSLKQLNNGFVYLASNPNLCFWPPSSEWDPILGDNGIYEGKNKNQTTCTEEGKVCHKECTSAGCWGPGHDECMQCQNFQLGKKCLQSCQSMIEIYQVDRKTCDHCHEECDFACHGPGSDNCAKCKNKKDGPYCVPECPMPKYPDENGICLSCNQNCRLEPEVLTDGCSGPLNNVGAGGCNRCYRGILDENDNVTQCLPAEQECPVGYFNVKRTHFNPHVEEFCRRCHPECKSCFSEFDTSCDGDCHHYYEPERQKCVANCSSEFYADNTNGQCKKCHGTCIGCRGPAASDCIKCHYYKVYSDYDSTEEPHSFNCTEECPEHAPFTTVVELDDGGIESVCVPNLVAGVSSQKKKAMLGVILGTVFGGIALLVIVVLVIMYFWRWRVKAEQTKLRLTARLTGMDESEPLTPTDAKPDMSHLRLLKESELRKGNIIGSGAFGTVYKGLWLPENDHVKIPVAIKVLQEGTSPNLNKELLEEARIMASVVNPNCVRILAVCMTAQMMLVTQLMPLGCLLDYVRKNRVNTGSKALLNWCTQIAKGMNYLEGRGIVHRDLAARNVLVQSPGQVKITDFGLAKLLDFDEEAFHASGGKMPIKWLALECIQNRIFTHKSDVWSYGVTIWELFTYGQRPYDNVTAREIPDLLEKGERLPQPSICTIDVYMIMIKCWMLDAFSRPSFKELAEEFAKMARDPGRYLVIQGDTLLRLPSQSYDTRDLVRNMSVAQDGDEQIMDAEEYLTPQGASNINMITPPHPMHNLNGRLDKVREDSLYDNDRLPSSRDCSRESEQQRPFREKKYSGLEAAAAMRKQREAAPVRDSINSRYSSDPCKVLMDHDALDKGEDEVDMPTMPAPPTPMAHNNEMPLTNMIKPPPHRLPVDEDDYLQPKSSNPAAYMDLVDGKQDVAPSEMATAPAQYLDMQNNPTPASAVQNPVYFEPIANNNPVNTDHLKSEKQPLRNRSMSTESEGAGSEHDYYNEYDHLNRNRKPGVYINPRTESAV